MYEPHIRIEQSSVVIMICMYKYHGHDEVIVKGMCEHYINGYLLSI